MRLINPELIVNETAAFFTERNAEDLLATKFDCIVDAIDDVPPKAYLIATCRERNIPLVVAGGVLSVAGAGIGLGFSLAGFLLFKVAPILLVGWVVVKVFEKSRGGGALSDADRRWLDGD